MLVFSLITKICSPFRIFWRVEFTQSSERFTAVFCLSIILSEKMKRITKRCVNVMMMMRRRIHNTTRSLYSFWVLTVVLTADMLYCLILIWAVNTAFIKYFHCQLPPFLKTSSSGWIISLYLYRHRPLLIKSKVSSCEKEQESESEARRFVLFVCFLHITSSSSSRWNMIELVISVIYLFLLLLDPGLMLSSWISQR